MTTAMPTNAKVERVTEHLDEITQVCECGHSQIDHDDFSADGGPEGWVANPRVCNAPGCPCANWWPW